MELMGLMGLMGLRGLSRLRAYLEIFEEGGETLVEPLPLCSFRV